MTDKEDMPARIPDTIKREIIRRRLAGQTFDEIKDQLGISHGYAVDTFKKWLQDLEVPTEEAVLEFVDTIRDLGTKPIECAKGIEIRALLLRHGLREDQVEPFLIQLFNQVLAAGIPAVDAAQSVQRMLNLSAMAGGDPIHVILDRADKAREDEVRIAANIRQLKKQQEDAINETENTLKEKQIMKENIEEYIRVKSELRRFGLTLDDNLQKIINVFKNVESLGFDPVRVAEVFSSAEPIIIRSKQMAEEIKESENELKEYKEMIQAAEIEARARSETLVLLQQLYSMGFSPAALTVWINKIGEISTKRSIPLNLAGSYFTQEVERYYDDVLGFQNQLEVIKSNITLGKQTTRSNPNKVCRIQRCSRFKRHP
jgi:hypothetical protein